MKIDVKNLRPAPKMQDPMRYPKVQSPLEMEMKQSYRTQMHKSLVDLTKRMVEMKTK